MYRLLKTRVFPFCRAPGVSSSFTSENVNFKVRDVIGHCTACARNQSSITNPSGLPKKNRKYRSKSKKNYQELVVVTESDAKQERAPITKLKWHDLKLLATTNLDLSELHKLKLLSNSNQYITEHTYNNLAVIDEVVAGSTELLDKTAPETSALRPVEDMLETLPVIDSFEPECMEEPLVDPEATQTADAKLPNKARYEIASKTMAAYIEVCSHLKNPARGLNALIFHNQRAKRTVDECFPILQSPKVFNTLLKGFAAKGDVGKVEEVLALMRNDDVKFDMQTYVVVLEAYSRVNYRNRYVKEIQRYILEATQNGHTPDKLLNYSIFHNDDRDLVLAAIKCCNKSFVPHYYKPIVQYNNELVNSLNSEVQLKGYTSETTNSFGQFTPESMGRAIDKQMDLERHCYLEVRSVETRSKPSAEVLKFREIMAGHLKFWEETATKAFIRDLGALAAQRSPLNYEPFLRCIPLKDFIAIIVNEAKRIAEGSETYSPTVNQLHRDLGRVVYMRYMTLRKDKTGVLDKVIRVHSQYCKDYAAQHQPLQDLPTKTRYLNPRQQWQWIDNKSKHVGATITMDHRPWTPTMLHTIGKFLYHIVMHDLKVDVNAMRPNKHKNYLPAFYTIFRTQGRLVKEEVKPHPVLSRLLRASMPETLQFPSGEVPMFCPPVPWTSIENGGYLVAPCDVVRLPQQAMLQKQRLYLADPQQLYPSLDSLNQLAAVPWRVNTDILDVILKVFGDGGSEKLDVPEPPSSLTPPPPITLDLDKAQRYKLFQRKLQYRRKKAEMYSLWCDCLYRLSLANHYRDNIFWLPHNMDFRGRVYPVPPHLNHLGSDLARSMLVFAEPRPLGPDGLKWLKLHLINLTGLKKRDSIADRLVYAEQIMDDILDSADNPLTGKMWWAESEEPWQTLACCMEIANATRSKDPQNYKSSFPVHQDGSCNGLQHYAALGRDSAGAYSVNLCASAVPQDVYSAVVTLVEQQRAIDAKNGIEVAKLLQGHVKRKVIKQTIMTTVYGVTRFGARLQIARQLKDLEDFPKDMVWAASSYLTMRTFDSLRSMFTSTREIQDWFTDCARLISMNGNHVEWVTPMGLPIVQPYIRFKNLGTNMMYKPYHMDQFEKPNVMKQKNAFPPNFIHSLDSSHMMLTSLFAERAGITFVSVHDCYWTHPSTVDIMNKICREQFVALHSLPILENLCLYLTEKYSWSEEDIKQGALTNLAKTKLSRVLQKLPKTGDFDINQVLRSVYFFS